MKREKVMLKRNVLYVRYWRNDTFHSVKAVVRDATGEHVATIGPMTDPVTVTVLVDGVVMGMQWGDDSVTREMRESQLEEASAAA